MKSGNLKFLEPSGALQACNGTALPFTRRGEWSAACPSRTLSPGKTRYSFYSRLGGPQGRSGWVENLVPTGIWSRTVQPVVSRYTDRATRPTNEILVWCKYFVQRVDYEKWWSVVCASYCIVGAAGKDCSVKLTWCFNIDSVNTKFLWNHISERPLFRVLKTYFRIRVCIYIYIYIYTYRVSQEERT